MKLGSYFVLAGTAWFFTTGQSVAAIDDEPIRKSILSCKFGANCMRDNVECPDHDLWYIVRYYENEDRMSLYSVRNSSEMSATVQTVGDITVFSVFEPSDGIRFFGGLTTMTVSSTLEASFQGSSEWEAIANQRQFSAFSHTGICRVIE